MSRIKEAIKEIQRSNEMFEGQEYFNSKKIAVTFRLEPDYLFRLDYLVEKLSLSRSNLAQNLVNAALIEAMEELGFDLDTQHEMWLKDLKAKGDAEKEKKGDK